MTSTLTPTIIPTATRVAAILGGALLGLSGCGGSDCGSLPREVVARAESPDGAVVAVILKWRPSDGVDLLGSDVRLFLGLQFEDAEVIVRRDLSEGLGGYEGGVHAVRWLNDHQVLVERSVADRRADLVFDLRDHSWLVEPER